MFLIMKKYQYKTTYDLKTFVRNGMGHLWQVQWIKIC